jgi:hypothetical protein
MSLLLLVGALTASDAWAAGRKVQAQPRRYERGSYGQYIVKKRQGQPVVSQVYSGYGNGFPPPAFLYYGYPHSGDMTGIGPLDRK